MIAFTVSTVIVPADESGISYRHYPGTSYVAAFAGNVETEGFSMEAGGMPTPAELLAAVESFHTATFGYCRGCDTYGDLFNCA